MDSGSNTTQPKIIVQGNQPAQQAPAQQFAQPAQPAPQPIPQAAPSQQPAPQMTQEQFVELLKSLSLSNSDFVSKLVNINTEKSDKRRFGIRKAVSHDQIDQEDILDPPVTFFAWGASTNVRDDFRNGQSIEPPYGVPIRFKNLYRYRRGSGRSSEVVMICHAVVHSKRQAEFIRSHSKFRVKYFETTRDVENLGAKYSHVINEVANEINRVGSQHRLIEMAKSHGIKISDDFAELKRRIIDAEAQRRWRNSGGRLESVNMPAPVDMRHGIVNPDEPEVYQNVRTDKY